MATKKRGKAKTKPKAKVKTKAKAKTVRRVAKKIAKPVNLKPKAKTLLFRRGEMTFAPYGGPPGEARIARLVTPELSRTMGGGLATFDGCSIEWTVLYDELVVVVEGLFRLRVGKDVFEAGPGDVIWIPEGTALKYEGEKALVCYILYPVDWRRRHGL
jgi:ethanolamine utilization protein EutQ